MVRNTIFKLCVDLKNLIHHSPQLRSVFNGSLASLEQVPPRQLLAETMSERSKKLLYHKIISLLTSGTCSERHLSADRCGTPDDTVTTSRLSADATLISPLLLEHHH